MADLALTLVWDLPVPYSSHNPIRLEETDGTMGRAWLYVEPDGDVLPTQGQEQVLGNLMRDSILDLWRRDAQSASLRAS
jgi:MoaA/NifB/PqqE/SkfB family radical SAM enzyme